MMADIERVLFEEAEIFRRLDAMAEDITRDYAGRELTAVAILNGSFIFMADLLRRIPLDLRVESLRTASYVGSRSSGEIDFRGGWIGSLQGRHILLLDDILDSGLTLHTVRQRLESGTGIASLRTCVLLRKNVPRVRPIEADYVGFDIPNEFVVGYGLDFNERFRNLPFIGVLSQDAIRREANDLGGAAQ